MKITYFKTVLRLKSTNLSNTHADHVSSQRFVMWYKYNGERTADWFYDITNLGQNCGWELFRVADKY